MTAFFKRLDTILNKITKSLGELLVYSHLDQLFREDHLVPLDQKSPTEEKKFLYCTVSDTIVFLEQYGMDEY